ncbi:DUF7310 family coiled-coil domain-containing protein [Halorubrum sp. DTA46]|uniref:DUF7310 family coiled-coil domain-containing protein n=1 Tax=Halorubrum sp. DTA46 TaxID=3402162 RepID=UPI003AB0A2EE
MSNDIDHAEPSSHGGTIGTTGATDATGSAGTGESSRGARQFEERLSAVERALTGSDATVADIGDEAAAAAAERDALAERLDDLESRVEELEAATQALRGYAGSIRAVNREVERRADLALARASGGGDGRAAGREEVDDRIAAGHDDHGSHDRHDDRNRGDATDGGAVPSESALDAAVPSSSVDADSDSVGCEEDGGGESWGTDALDRLRESL